ncbi:MAG: hypothetical protein E6H04_12825 [Bacillati bacterium ANGP1]|uniref:UDP-glucose/GDP-mannose dehydrogenase N-terminal domain-containing protein n=1 Tax=Candidatus Segetimicrobium genomatis TaxID=2569760 RepID=A0A537J585_9BACT|nr:MAG: hypothetical protein E6H04_12825 [Terrabacteria group bacterium ANGP1]
MVARVPALQGALPERRRREHCQRHHAPPRPHRALPRGPGWSEVVSRPVVGFAGLTHLGLVSAAVTASKGFRAVAFDPDGARVKESAAGRLPVVEPGLGELLRAARSQVVFTERAADGRRRQ